MAMTPEADEIKTVAGHTFAYQRTLDKKVDLVIGSLQRQGERLARVERDIAEIRRDVPDLMLRPGARGFAIAQRRAMHGFAIVLEALRAFRPSLGHAVPGLLTLGITREFRHALAIGGMAAKFVGWIDVVMDRAPLRGELRRRGSVRPRHGCETPLRGRRAAASIGRARATPSCRPCPANPRRGEDTRWPVPDTHRSAWGATSCCLSPTLCPKSNLQLRWDGKVPETSCFSSFRRREPRERSPESIIPGHGVAKTGIHPAGCSLASRGKPTCHRPGMTGARRHSMAKMQHCDGFAALQLSKPPTGRTMAYLCAPPRAVAQRQAPVARLNQAGAFSLPARRPIPAPWRNCRGGFQTRSYKWCPDP